MPRGRHRHSPPLHRLLPPSAIAGVSAVCAVGPWLFSEPLVLRGLAAGAAVTAAVGAVVLRRWDASAGRRVADLARGRASDEWRYEERVAELESDLDESRELRTKLEQRLRAKRAELAGLRNEHAALLRRYATAETERATVLESRRLLEIEAAEPVPELTDSDATSEETAPEESADAAPEATAATVQAALAASSAASVLYVKANAALDRLPGARTGTETGAADDQTEDAAPADDSAADEPTVKAGSPTAESVTAEAEAEGEAEPEAEAAASESADSTPDGPAPDDPAPSTPPKGGPVKRTSAKTGARKGSPSPGGPGKGAPRPGGSPKAASAAGGTMTSAPAKGETWQEGETPGKPEAVDGHERTAAAAAPVPTQSTEPVRPRKRATPIGVTSLQSTSTRTKPRSAPAARTAPEPDTAHASAPTAAPESPGTDLVRPPRHAGHFTVPTAVAVAPATPARRPVEGGFDFFGTQKGAKTLEAVQNEDLADVVGQEALALHKSEAETGFRPAGEESRGVGQVIDLTAHDETEQIDVAGLRSAVS
ncbi:hypothetical protein ACFFS2_26430 [Streptomyces aurantiacus]|uniref:hypothetical protein n=1 Tax=Streptomyces aurantiacus TaxID=47760 RepID=UPI001FE3AD0B|nr:hypothetical protein [Streptomyces aurantiacus]